MPSRRRDPNSSDWTLESYEEALGDSGSGAAVVGTTKLEDELVQLGGVSPACPKFLCTLRLLVPRFAVITRFSNVKGRPLISEGGIRIRHRAI